MEKLNINKMIMEAMKSGNKAKTEVYRAIKNEFLKFLTSENNINKVLTPEEEVTILKRMVKERCTSADIYKAAGRNDLMEKEMTEVKYLRELLPTQPSEADIRKYIESTYTLPLTEKMGTVIGEVKKNLSNVDGKMLAEIVKSYIK